MACNDCFFYDDIEKDCRINDNLKTDCRDHRPKERKEVITYCQDA